MKTLTRLGAIIALSAACSMSVSAQEDPVLKSQMDSLQKWGAACMQAKGGAIETVCKSSLDSTLKLQPEINYTNQLMMSFMVEAHARSNLSNYYLRQENVGAHCDQAEKVLLAGLYASQNKGHQFYPPIKQIADSHLTDVKTCRKLFGTPEGTVKLD